MKKGMKKGIEKAVRDHLCPELIGKRFYNMEILDVDVVLKKDFTNRLLDIFVLVEKGNGKKHWRTYFKW